MASSLWTSLIGIGIFCALPRAVNTCPDGLSYTAKDLSCFYVVLLIVFVSTASRKGFEVLRSIR